MSSKQNEHWTKTKSLTTTTLVIWAIISFVIHWFGEGLNSDAFPGAYFMAGMGSQVAFAVLVFLSFFCSFMVFFVALEYDYFRFVYLCGC